MCVETFSGALMARSQNHQSASWMAWGDGSGGREAKKPLAASTALVLKRTPPLSTPPKPQWTPTLPPLRVKRVVARSTRGPSTCCRNSGW